MDGGKARPTPRSDRQLPFLAIEPRVGARVQLVVPRFGGGSSYSSAVIGWVEGEYLIVRRPLESGLGVQLHAGETLLLRLFTGTDVAEFRCTVQRAFNTPLNYLHVDYPAQVRAWRLRSEPRLPVQLAAQAQPAGQDRTISVRVADLSTGGARLLSPASLGGRGQVLTLTLQPLPAAAAAADAGAASGEANGSASNEARGTASIDASKEVSNEARDDAGGQTGGEASALQTGARPDPAASAAAAVAPLVLTAHLRSERAEGTDPQGSYSCGIQFEPPGAEQLAALRALIDASRGASQHAAG